MRWLSLIGSCLLASCASRRPFAILPAPTEPELRSPASSLSPFSRSLTDYGFRNSDGSVNLQPGLQLRVENAYYEKGAPKRGLAGFVGTETVRYEVRRGSLRLIDAKTEIFQRPNELPKTRPDDQPPAVNLIPAAQLRLSRHRLLFAVTFRRANQASGAVLLSARNSKALDALAERVRLDPDANCTTAADCTIFPETCSATAELEVTIKGKSSNIIWGTTLQRVLPPGAEIPKTLRLSRQWRNRHTPVELDSADLASLRLPLFPGDVIDW